jgi:hypothetical protein
MIPANDNEPSAGFDWSLLWAVPVSTIGWVIIVREIVRIWVH